MSTSAISQVKSASSVSTSHKPQLLKVTVACNDPSMHAKATSQGFKLWGLASNNGIMASYLKLNFDKKELKLQLGGGETGVTVFSMLKKALPKGYEARLLSNNKANPPVVTIGISRRQTAPAPQISKIPTTISANNASAKVDASLWINLMPGSASQVLASVAVKGAGHNGVPPKLAVKGIDVYQKGTNKKVGSFKSPALVDTELKGATKAQSYRLELPSTLDLNKTYTFVVKAELNGSSAKSVRSQYVDVDRAY